MNFNAINTVTTALQTRLEDALNAGVSPVTQHVFVGPLDDAAAVDTLRLHLFLYRIAVNADLRSCDHAVPAAAPNQPPTVYRGGLPLDLYYLLTAGTRTGGGELADLTLLGQAMQALNDAPLLSGVNVKNETARITLDPVGSEEMSRIWALFPTANYRTSVVYLVSPVWIDPGRPPAPETPVVEEPHLVGHLGN